MTDINSGSPQPNAEESRGRIVLGRAVIGLRWTAGFRLASQVLSWIVTILVVRLLTPVDYGLMAMAGVVTGLAAVVDDIGLGTALVQRPHVNSSVFHGVFGIVLLVSIALVFMLSLVAYPLASLMNEPSVVSVVQVVSIAVACNVLGSPARALLVRHSRFGVLGGIELAAVVSASLTSLALAFAGLGVWALVAANIVNSGLRLILFARWTPCRIRIRFDNWSEVLPLARFGAAVSIARLFSYAATNLDKAIVGRVLGTSTLGYFSIGEQLARIPVDKGTSVLTQVAYPAFARLAGTAGRGRHEIEKLLALNTAVFLPIMWVASVCWSDLLPAAIGQHWAQVVPVFALFALAVPLEMTRSLLDLALTAAGRADIVVKNAGTFLATILVGVSVGSQYSLTGAAAGWALGFGIAWVWVAIRASRYIGLRPARVFGVLWVPALSTSVAIVAVNAIIAQADPARTLVVQAISGAVALILAYFLIWILDRQTAVGVWHAGLRLLGLRGARA